MGPLSKSLPFAFHPSVQSYPFQIETMPKFSSIIKSPSSYKLADFDVKCNSTASFSHKKVNYAIYKVQTLCYTVCMISEDRRYRIFSQKTTTTKVPLELIFGSKYKRTRRLEFSAAYNAAHMIKMEKKKPKQTPNPLAEFYRHSFKLELRKETFTYL